MPRLLLRSAVGGGTGAEALLALPIRTPWTTPSSRARRIKRLHAELQTKLHFRWKDDDDFVRVDRVKHNLTPTIS